MKRREWAVVAVVLAVSVGVLAASPEDLVGRWDSARASYAFTYGDGQLICSKLGTDEVYACRIFGSTLAGTYVLDGVTQTETAEIVLDASGWPVEIHWDHGAIFVRVDSAESISAFVGTWEGQDVDDDSLTTLVITEVDGRLLGTLSDTYSIESDGTIVSPGYWGLGTGETTSDGSVRMTFFLTRSDGDEVTMGTELTLSDSRVTLRYSEWNDYLVDPAGVWADLESVEEEAAGAFGTETKGQSSGDCSAASSTAHVSTSEGAFEVLEHEMRNVNGEDIYVYEVKNTGHANLCSFSLPLNGLTPSGVDNSLAPCWVWDSSDPGRVTWSVDAAVCPGDDGLAPGESGTFFLKFQSPTADAGVTGRVETCGLGGFSQGPGIPDVAGHWLFWSYGFERERAFEQKGDTFMFRFNMDSAVSPAAIQEDHVAAFGRIKTPPEGTALGWEYEAWVVFHRMPAGDIIKVRKGKIYAHEVSVLGESNCILFAEKMSLAQDFTRPSPDLTLRGVGPCEYIAELAEAATYEFETCGPMLVSQPSQVPTSAESQAPSPFAPPPPSCAASPESIDFGTVAVGAESAWKAFTIENTGSTAVSGWISLTGSNASAFDFLGSCASYQLDPNETKTCRVRFEPSSSGSKEAYVSIGSSCSDIRLCGTGEEEEVEETCPDIVVTSISACWYYPASEDCFVEADVTVKNQGTATATGVSVNLTASCSCEGFKYDPGSSASVGTLTAGQSKTVTIQRYVCGGSTCDPNPEYPVSVTATASCNESECNTSDNSRSGTASSGCP